MRLTIIEDDGDQQIAKDAEGNLYANENRLDRVTWAPIMSYSVEFPEGNLVVPYIPDPVRVLVPTELSENSESECTSAEGT